MSDEQKQPQENESEPRRGGDGDCLTGTIKMLAVMLAIVITIAQVLA